MIELLHLQCWIESSDQKGFLLSIKLGKRTPTLVKNYYPGTKIHIFDTVIITDLPTVEISFDECQQKQFNLRDFLGHQTQPHVQIIDDSRILFTFELLDSTQKLYKRYCREKSNSEKHYLCEGIKDFIRSQQEFLAQYERNQDIDKIRQLQAEESRIERDLCEQIMKTRKFSVSFGKILIIMVLFMFVGFIFGKHGDSSEGNFISNLLYPMKVERKKMKVSKLKPNRIVKKQRQRKKRMK